VGQNTIRIKITFLFVIEIFKKEDKKKKSKIHLNLLLQAL
jgi:hypothetical protein